ncbi:MULTISPECIES: penicillinase repressor BlaI [Brevibacillus]|uniref:Penicillinase repressor BlaI n=1 Tax=Brevibacillus brevis TaxID=1393 RepID=A0A2Z4ME75_BREBE|nr:MULTISPECIES: penicillinase repressor BlaI [Brevibacillus]AWX54709.1 penicillinase repressor BlaI [Brevibacillus brevis]NRR22992.1 penicillinase repressor BlaI [Brevibacillus sp. MS2.2]RAT96799.1 penicillinase repressor BlaI [Brevibacillus sp. Leaf182]
MSTSMPSISEAEWRVMNVLWEKSPLTANEIISSLEGQTDWNPKTVRTLLNRLVQKNAVGVNQNQRVYTFYPLYSQNECQHAEAQSFLERIYSGALKSMLVQFIQKESLSDEEIQELRSILDAKQASTDHPKK